jgi:hypothetical protein
MRKVSIALSAVGALLMLGASSAAKASPRAVPDATPACGNGCFNLYKPRLRLRQDPERERAR